MHNLLFTPFESCGLPGKKLILEEDPEKKNRNREFKMATKWSFFPEKEGNLFSRDEYLQETCL